MDGDTLELVGILAVLLLSLSWHEAAHAWVADRLGDPTARSLGRVSLNPLRHLDPFLSVILPVAMYLTAGVAFGGGKPVPIDPSHFRNRARDFMLVALAGPFSNLLLAVFGCALYLALGGAGVFDGDSIANPYGGAHLAYRASLLRAAARLMRGDELQTLAETLVVWGVALNVLLAVFNLMPIPPLDGSRVVGWLLPRRLQSGWYRLDRLGILIVLVLFLGMDGYRWILVRFFMPVLTVFARTTDHILTAAAP